MSRLGPPVRPSAAVRGGDVGSILPMVMCLVIVVSMVVVSLASYVTADLRYSRVVEDRADRLAAADGGLRFGVERLRNFQTLCTTGAGSGGGFTTVFPPEINGATTTVTCRKVGKGISDVQGWGVVVTGAGVPTGQKTFLVQGGGGVVKTFSGPVYVSDPTRMDLRSSLEIADGDLWYSAANCAVPQSSPVVVNLTFTPNFLRGPMCTQLTWNGGLFRPPSASTPPATGLVVSSSPPTLIGQCTVFSPGLYTTTPTLSANNYFKAGEYVFQNVTLVLQNKTLIAGFPKDGGDAAKIRNDPCAAEQAADKAAVGAGGRGGATFWLGGSSKFEIDNGGELEIFRRLQGGANDPTYLSVYALDSPDTGTTPRYTASTVDWNTSILETKSGSNNDVAIHGLFWAPRAKAMLGNITNAANGQLLGGIVVALLDTQASASASAFSIGIETSDIDTTLLLTSTATKNGASTSIRAVVQYRPDSGELAVNSWRVAIG